MRLNGSGTPASFCRCTAFAHGRTYFCISFSYHSGRLALVQSLDFIDCQQSNRLCDFFIGECPPLQATHALFQSNLRSAASFFISSIMLHIVATPCLTVQPHIHQSSALTAGLPSSRAFDFIDCQFQRVCDLFIRQFTQSERIARADLIAFSLSALRAASLLISSIIFRIVATPSAVFFKIANSVRQNLIMHFICTACRQNHASTPVCQRRIIFYLSIHIQNMRPMSPNDYAGFLDSPVQCGRSDVRLSAHHSP